MEVFCKISVGGGTSGLVVANRLSEHFSVLVLEAGGDPFPLQNVPIAAPLMLSQKPIDWNFYTVSQQYSCLSLNNRVGEYSNNACVFK